MEIIHPSSEQWPEYRQIRLAAFKGRAAGFCPFFRGGEEICNPKMARAGGKRLHPFGF